MNIGPGEMILLLVLALLLFGPRRLPEIGRAVGEGIASFKRAVNAMTAPEWESKPARQV
ncbi:MAG TPA: twin-arginine translocase TatA/TatE family subunit, partial [Candidatus Nitrosotenuis sp.]|nr:twin-arginine translocase TatA/TatE family subunit [Candidatus Nitrosotenuis sp.]